MKGDAYGHSSAEVARALASEPGLHAFAVATLEEAIALRQSGIRGRIYVLSGIQSVDKRLVAALDEFKLVPVVSSLPAFRDLARFARKRLSVHLKFNTGMNRLGIEVSEADGVIKLLEREPHIQLEGILSHFAASEVPKKEITRLQVARFRELVTRFRSAGLPPRFHHMENSFGLFNHVYPEGSFARVGLHLYGEGEGLDDLVEPVARWTAQIFQIRDVAAGEGVGYGPIYRAKRASRIAVLGVGYADGYPRALSNEAEVLVLGKRCKVIGAISMDLMAVDISNVPAAKLSTPVILLGKDRNERITAVELSKRAGTIPWEILTGISARVPRVFRA